jgi:hypothetical protein
LSNSSGTLHPEMERRVQVIESTAAERDDVDGGYFAAVFGVTIGLPVALMILGWSL